MNFSGRIIMQTPLKEVWNDSGVVSQSRLRNVGTLEIKELLRLSPLFFVIADVGLKLEWIAPEKCNAFWKNEVQPHLIPVEINHFHLEDYPKEYAYRATEWEGSLNYPIIVLEKYH